MRKFGASENCNLEKEKQEREQKTGIKMFKSCHLRPFGLQLTVT